MKLVPGAACRCHAMREYGTSSRLAGFSLNPLLRFLWSGNETCTRSGMPMPRYAWMRHFIPPRGIQLEPALTIFLVRNETCTRSGMPMPHCVWMRHFIPPSAGFSLNPQIIFSNQRTKLVPVAACRCHAMRGCGTSSRPAGFSLNPLLRIV
jgi:hypothetical protein